MILNADGLVVRDVSGKRQGRGAYVCPAKDCIEGLGKGALLKRAFRSDGAVAVHAELFDCASLLKT